MLFRSFQLFFVQPLKEMVFAIKSHVIFIYNFFINSITCKNCTSKTAEDLTNEGFMVFKFIIFCIIANIGINEAFFDINADLIKEIQTQIVYLLFFYVSFTFCYYIFYLYGKLVKNPVHTIILSSNWLIVMIATTIVFQFTGLLNPSHISQNGFYELMSIDILWTILVYFLVLVVQMYQLYKKQTIKWFDIFVYLISWVIFSLLLIVKGVIIQGLILKF
jgi:hypothetical protein